MLRTLTALESLELTGTLGPLGGQNVHKMVKFREAQANAG